MYFDSKEAYSEIAKEVAQASASKQLAESRLVQTREKQESAVVARGLEEFKRRNQSKKRREKEAGGGEKQESGLFSQLKSIFTGSGE